MNIICFLSWFLLESCLPAGKIPKDCEWRRAYGDIRYSSTIVVLPSEHNKRPNQQVGPKPQLKSKPKLGKCQYRQSSSPFLD